MILEEEYTEGTHEKKTGQDTTLLNKLHKAYGKPKTVIVTEDEHVAQAIYEGYIALRQGSKTAWNALNSRYILGTRARFMGITYTILNKLNSGFHGHKYFASRTPTEDDFQEVLLQVLTYLYKTELEYNNKFPGLLLNLVTDRTKNHLRNTLRLENRGLGKASVYLYNIDDLQRTHEYRANAELDESDTFDRVRLFQPDYDDDMFCRDSPETPEEAYEKAQMAAW